jgi:serine/threonine protein phosphatase PrpC
VARKRFAHNSPGSRKDFFAAVMDGHGLAGKHVSGFVKSQFTQEEVQQRLLAEPTEDTLTWAFHKAASEIKRSGIDCRESGSTTVSCLRRGDQLLVANVGDSRCVAQLSALVAGSRLREGEGSCFAAAGDIPKHHPWAVPRSAQRGVVSADSSVWCRCVMGREEGGTLMAKDLSYDHKPELQTEYERITRSNGAPCAAAATLAPSAQCVGWRLAALSASGGD